PALAWLLSACSSNTPSLHLDVNSGQESSAMKADPPVVRVDVTAISPDGTKGLIASVAPGGSFDLGDITNDQHLTFEVSGLDAKGQTVVRGRSLGAIPVGSLAGTLPVFVQRVNTWARPDNGLLHTHVGGAAGVIAQRSLILSGGTAA